MEDDEAVEEKEEPGNEKYLPCTLPSPVQKLLEVREATSYCMHLSNNSPSHYVCWFYS